MLQATQNGTTPIRIAQVQAGAPQVTARALREQLGRNGHAIVLVFAAPTIARDELAAALQSEFGSTPVVGCSTAGEIGLTGLATDSVAAVALPAEHCVVEIALLRDVRNTGIAACREAIRRQLARLTARGRRPTAENTFGLLLVDGLSGSEELLANNISSVLEDIPLVGGSAGDGLSFRQAHVFAEGGAHTGAAVLALVRTDLPFVVFKTQHFVPGEQRLVVTRADAQARIVHELDGEPAATSLARVLGVPEPELGPTAFATNPMVVRIGGAEYVRSVQKVEEDGSLRFYCAIEEGVVLRDAKGVDIEENLAETLATIRTQVGEPRLTIAFDCILRRLECERDGKMASISKQLEAARCVGFSTYGEQYRGMHVNQTLTGVCFGSGR